MWKILTACLFLENYRMVFPAVETIKNPAVYQRDPLNIILFLPVAEADAETVRCLVQSFFKHAFACYGAIQLNITQRQFSDV